MSHLNKPSLLDYISASLSDNHIVGNLTVDYLRKLADDGAPIIRDKLLK